MFSKPPSNPLPLGCHFLAVIPAEAGIQGWGEGPVPSPSTGEG